MRACPDGFAADEDRLKRVCRRVQGALRPRCGEMMPPTRLDHNLLKLVSDGYGSLRICTALGNADRGSKPVFIEHHAGEVVLCPPLLWCDRDERELYLGCRTQVVNERR
jgi:hypothetical protein